MGSNTWSHHRPIIVDLKWNSKEINKKRFRRKEGPLPPTLNDMTLALKLWLMDQKAKEEDEGGY
eukprot:11362475-Prorocentrum_lima.AAC.1